MMEILDDWHGTFYILKVLDLCRSPIFTLLYKWIYLLLYSLPDPTRVQVVAQKQLGNSKHKSFYQGTRAIVHYQTSWESDCAGSIPEEHSTKGFYSKE